MSFETITLHYLLEGANLVIGISYLVIFGIIMQGIIIQKNRRGQVSTLSVMMGAMFISCGITHIMHLVSAHIVLDTYATVLAQTLWIQVLFDIVTAAIAVAFLTLRKSYGIVIDGPNALIEAKDKLKIKNEQLQSLYNILSAADDTLNLDKMTKNVLLKSSEVLGTKGGAIYLMGKDRIGARGTVLQLSASMGNSFVFPKEFSLTSANGNSTASFSFSRYDNAGIANVFLNVIKSGKIFLVENKSELQRLDISIPNSESLIIVPLRKNELVGLFLLFDSKPRTFIKEEIAFLEAIGSQIGNSIEKATLYVNALESKHQAELLSELQKDFINIASHEMRTPVQSLLGYTHLLKTHPEKKEMITDSLLRNAQRLQRLTEDILDVSRIESKSLKLNKEKVNLTDIVSTAIQDVQSLIKNDNGNARIMFEPRYAAIVEADKGRLTQVITNLLINAIKFTKGGTININITKRLDADIAIISVKDSGMGIAQEMLPRLFNKFATKSETGGTGLGLFISKSIVEAHGGKMWAQNNEDGKGSTFVFSLPIKKEIIASTNG